MNYSDVFDVVIGT